MKTSNHNYPSIIYGKGFGLKVYLPALIDIGIKKIFINKNEISELHNKSILEKYKKYIICINEKEYKNQLFNYMILAISPSKQYNFLKNNKIINNTNTLILEKPIAPSPDNAANILKKLDQLNIDYQINYSFRYAIWYKELHSKINNLPKKSELFFIWNFKAKHYINKQVTWKSCHYKGGGAIRFYGIHLLAILSDIGYQDIKKSNLHGNKSNNLDAFSCSFNSNEKLPKCTIFINSNSSKNEFNCHYIKDNKRITLLDLEAPFPCEDFKLKKDPRIEIVKTLLTEKKFDYDNIKVNKLWKSVEDKIVNPLFK